MLSFSVTRLKVILSGMRAMAAWKGTSEPGPKLGDDSVVAHGRARSPRGNGKPAPPARICEGGGQQADEATGSAPSDHHTDGRAQRCPAPSAAPHAELGFSRSHNRLALASGPDEVFQHLPKLVPTAPLAAGHRLQRASGGSRLRNGPDSDAERWSAAQVLRAEPRPPAAVVDAKAPPSCATPRRRSARARPH